MDTGALLRQRLHHIWIPEQFHPFCLPKQEDLRLELVKSGQNGNPSLSEPEECDVNIGSFLVCNRHQSRAGIEWDDGLETPGAKPLLPPAL